MGFVLDKIKEITNSSIVLELESEKVFFVFTNDEVGKIVNVEGKTYDIRGLEKEDIITYDLNKKVYRLGQKDITKVKKYLYKF